MLGTAQPGVMYRDFEKLAAASGLFFPPYPASKELCAIGGIVNNNSGGEKSLIYGKAEDYIESVNMILADGNEYSFKELSANELEEKKAQDNFEGEIYRKTHTLIVNNYDLLQNAKPKVSKNSAGYFLWNVLNKNKNTFNLVKLFVGAQGTLGLMSEATLKLVHEKKYAGMAVILLDDFQLVDDVVKVVMPFKPESFESYDDHTFKMAVRFFPSFAKVMGLKSFIKMGFGFIPDLWQVIKGGVPKLFLLAEFTSDSESEINEKLIILQNKLKDQKFRVLISKNRKSSKKYWTIRRESFNLLRKHVSGKHTAPFIDDIIVNPEHFDEFLPKIRSILDEYPQLTSTIAGHVGDGNFHIIPLMDFKKEENRKLIPIISKRVYDLVLQYNGSITAEHNDGLIRTPFLKQMYGEEIYSLFAEVKNIFDPLNIFNPGKKVGGDIDYAMKRIIKT